MTCEDHVDEVSNQDEGSSLPDKHFGKVQMLMFALAFVGLMGMSAGMISPAESAAISAWTAVAILVIK